MAAMGTHRRSSNGSTPSGAPRTTSPSARSTCSTTRCSASPCARRAREAAAARPLWHGPGLNLIWAHMNRAIRARELDAISSAAPVTAARASSRAPTSRTYTERYPQVTLDEPGLKRLFRQFSFPGGIPSHAAPETPGSIHEGGELGYSLAHAYGAAFDNPDLIVCCVVGDGEAETGPLAASWHSNKFLDPETRRRRAAGAPPERLQDREPDRARADPRAGARLAVEGTATSRSSSPAGSTARTHWASTSGSRRPGRGARRNRERRARAGRGGKWPMIILRTPKGWTGPKEVDGMPVEDTWRRTRCRSRAARTRST